MSQEEDIKKILMKLKDIDVRLQKLEKPGGVMRKAEKPKIGEPKEGIKKLADKIKVSDEDILCVFDVEEDSITLVNIIGEDTKEKVKNATLLVLLGYKYFFCIDEVLAQEIKRNIAENKISVGNVSRYIQEMIPSLVRKRGEPRSTKTTYRLTTPGDVKARDLLREICES